MKLIKLFLTLSSSLIYSMQEPIIPSFFYQDTYENKHKYEIDFNNFNKLPKVLELEIFSYISDELKSLFEFKFAGQEFGSLYLKLADLLKFKRYRYIFNQMHLENFQTDLSRTLVRVYDSETGTCKCEFFNEYGGPISLSKDGRYTVIYWFYHARVLDLDNRNSVKHKLKHDGIVQSIVISQDDKYVVTCSYDKTAKVWELETGILKHTLKYTDGIRFVAISSDCRYVLTSSFDYKTQLWELKTNSIIRTFNQDSMIESVAISGNNKYIITGDTKKNLKIWDLETGDLKYTFNCIDIVKDITTSANGLYILAGFNDNRIRLFTLPIEQTRIIKLLNSDQLNLVLDLLRLNKIVGKSIVTLNKKQGTIFVTLPLIIKAALKRRYNLRYKPENDFVYFV